MTLTDTKPALISTKAAVAVAELTLASLKDEMRRMEGTHGVSDPDAYDVLSTRLGWVDHAVEDLKQAQVWLQMAQEEEKAEDLRSHLARWAPGNLQHHLMFDHKATGPLMYDGPLNQIHAEAHAKEEA